MTVNRFENVAFLINFFGGSDIIMFKDETKGNLYRLADAGVSWQQIKDVPMNKALRLIMHPFDRRRAYILTASKIQFQTDDRGETWTRFDSKALPSKFSDNILIFHARDPGRIILNGMDCEGMSCNELATYTINGFKTNSYLWRNTLGCR